MRQVNIHAAKTHLSALVANTTDGEFFAIVNESKPLVKIVPHNEPTSSPRIGFLKGQISVPDDFDTMFGDEILAMFLGEDKV